MHHTIAPAAHGLVWRQLRPIVAGVLATATRAITAVITAGAAVGFVLLDELCPQLLAGRQDVHHHSVKLYSQRNLVLNFSGHQSLVARQRARDCQGICSVVPEFVYM